MLHPEKNFPSLFSMPAKGRTIALKFFLAGLFILIMGSLAGMIIFSFWIRDIEISLILLGFSIPVFSFLLWIAIAEFSSKEPKYTQITVDEKGLHHYGKNGAAHSLLYESLCLNNEGGPYDVLWTDRGYSEGDFELYIFTESGQDSVKAQPVKLKTDTLIRNSKALFAHFIKGVMLFRPDLKIEPAALEKYTVT